jgi:hypothetical protein
LTWDLKIQKDHFFGGATARRRVTLRKIVAIVSAIQQLTAPNKPKTKFISCILETPTSNGFHLNTPDTMTYLPGISRGFHQEQQQSRRCLSVFKESSTSAILESIFVPHSPLRRPVDPFLQAFLIGRNEKSRRLKVLPQSSASIQTR